MTEDEKIKIRMAARKIALIVQEQWDEEGLPKEERERRLADLEKALPTPADSNGLETTLTK